MQWLAWRPLLVLSAALVAGVAASDLCPKTVPAAIALAGAAAAFAAVAWAVRGTMADMAMIFAAMLAGACWGTARAIPAGNDIHYYAPSKPKEMVATVGYRGLSGRWAVCRALEVVYDDGVRRRASGWFLLKTRPGWKLPVGARVVLVGPIRLRPWRPRTNPFQRSDALRWGRRRVWCYAKAAGVRVVRRPTTVAVDDLAAAWRAALTRRLELAMPGRQPERPARLLAAIIYGAPLGELPDEVVELYRRTGTIHVLVVSGSQVTFLVLALIVMTGRRRRPAQIFQLALVLPATFFYATLCGKEPSILRAVALATILVLGRWGGRLYDIGTALAVTAAIFALAEPADLFAPGLQLTFAACLGVVGAARLLPEMTRWPAAARVAAYTLAGTAGAWMMTAPILAYHFGGLALAGSVANAIVVPAAEAALAVGIVGLALAMVHPLMATGPLWIARLLIDASVAVNSACARLPAAYLDGLRITLPLAALWYAAAVAGYVLARYSSGRWKAAAVTLTAAAAAGLLAVAAVPRPPGAVQVTWLDVGEGLCTVIETPGRQFIIFDAGSRDPDLMGWRLARWVLVPFLQSRGCRAIAAVVVSHADVDHFNAVETLMDAFTVRRLIVPPWGQGKRYGELLAKARSRGIAVAVARAGARLRAPRVRVTFLHPQSYPVRETKSADNDNCLVAMLEAAGHRVLLTGDLERAGQSELLAARGIAAVRADVLQVPHHGRRGAYWPRFLEAVGPAVAVVPCGPGYVGGAPDRDLLSFLELQGARVFETSRWGAITVTLAEAGAMVETFLRRPLAEPVAVLAPAAAR